MGTDQRMDEHAMYAQKAMIFQYIFQFLQKHPRTNGWTYPLNAIAASKKVIKKPRELSLALIPGPSRLSLKKTSKSKLNLLSDIKCTPRWPSRVSQSNPHVQQQLN